ncbi:MAG: hypothetical protein C0520_08225 [Sphingopyxis sp.]|nr:hypothetical protein [Sphingopyxis sp.]
MIKQSIFPIRSGLKWIAVALSVALFLISPAAAQNLTSHCGDWILLADDTMALALTTDGDETAFGLVCGQDCRIYIENRTSCIEGREYPVTIGAGSGTLGATLACKRVDGGLLLTMPMEERFLTLIAKQDSVRFEIPREGGEAQVLRFPLGGSEQAMGMALAARAYIKPGDTPGLAAIAGSPENIPPDE